MIVGAGAVGCFLGARLGLSGHKIVLVGRPALAEAVSQRGLTLIEPDGSRRPVPGISAASSVSGGLAAYGVYDLALLTVKAYDTAEAAAELRAAGAGGPILTMQNGVGNEEILAAQFGQGAVISGAIETPVSVPALGQVQVHRSRYNVGLAPAGPGAPRDMAAVALAQAGFDVTAYPDYRGLKWTKLLMNLLANAASAILDWTPAQLMACPLTARLEARAWQEAIAVMAGLGVHPVRLAGYPFPVLLPLAHRLTPGLLARLLRGFVAGGRGSKMPSLQIALAAGHPTEVGWLNGAVARCGEELGLAVPVNTLYSRLVAGLTDGTLQWGDYRNQPERLAEQLA